MRDGFYLGILLGFIVLVWAVLLTCAAFTSWRPQVVEWGERTSPHQAAVMYVPERIVWEGVEYDCVLREKEDSE